MYAQAAKPATEGGNRKRKAAATAEAAAPAADEAAPAAAAKKARKAGGSAQQQQQSPRRSQRSQRQKEEQAAAEEEDGPAVSGAGGCSYGALQRWHGVKRFLPGQDLNLASRSGFEYIRHQPCLVLWLHHHPVAVHKTGLLKQIRAC